MEKNAEIKKADVTVVITNWNYGDYIRSAFLSVLGQTVQPQEMVVVDDASDDGSLKIIEEFSHPFDIVRHSEQKGATAAYQSGLNATHTKWVIFLDADDELPPNYIEAMLKTAKDRDAKWVYCDFDYITADGKFIRRQNFPVVEKNFMTRLAAGNFIHSAALVQTELLKEAGGWIEDPYEDWHLWKRVAESGHVAVKCSDTALRYRQHGPSRMHGGRGK